MDLKVYVYDRYWQGTIIVVSSDKVTALKEIASKLGNKELSEEQLKTYDLVDGLVIETDGE